MKILFVINTGLIGGLQRHVLCLMRALKGVAETAVVINTEIDPQVVALFEDAGMRVYRLRGRSGHDVRVVGRFMQVVREFKPDVIHAHGLPMLVAAVLLVKKWLGLKRIPVLHSLHCPTDKPTAKKRIENLILDRLVDYWLPVSTPTWKQFLRWHPKAKGEVFFNPAYLPDFAKYKKEGWKVGGLEGLKVGKSNNQTIKQSNNFTVGMVGRSADQKDWPSFHKVEAIVQSKLANSTLQLQLPATTKITFLNAGEESVCDGRAAIAQMDLFVMTSKHEQLPTTVLECFAIGTPICGFLPDGGTSDILSFSKGPVDAAFLRERSCEKLAELVIDLLQYPEKRQALVEDGRQILEGHFDAEKNCQGQLMGIYARLRG